MIKTHAEVLEDWSSRQGIAVYVGQRSGTLSWTALYGDRAGNAFVNKGAVVLKSQSVFALRPAIRTIKGFKSDVAKLLNEKR